MNYPTNITHKLCHHCEGKGYIEIRDCSAEVQREETCVFCQGKGQVETIAHDTQSISERSN